MRGKANYLLICILHCICRKSLWKKHPTSVKSGCVLVDVLAIFILRWLSICPYRPWILTFHIAGNHQGNTHCQSRSALPDAVYGKLQCPQIFQWSKKATLLNIHEIALLIIEYSSIWYSSPLQMTKIHTQYSNIEQKIAQVDIFNGLNQVFCASLNPNSLYHI